MSVFLSVKPLKKQLNEEIPCLLQNFSQKTLEYRARSFVWLFWDVAPSIMMLFFWSAAFKTRNQVAGYDFYSMAIYYLIVMFSRNLVLTHPTELLQQKIYSGKISVYFLKPASMIILKFFYEIAYKISKISYFLPLFIICYLFFLKDQSASFSFKLINFGFFILGCSISFCLYFLIRILLGFTAFWFTEIEWLRGLEDLIFWFFGGLLLPLDLMPEPMQFLANFLPFKYLFYLPTQGFLGKLSLKQMFFSLIIQFFWLGLFFILVKKIYKASLKIYSAFGG